MRINFACGRQVLDGYFNIDAVRHAAAERDPDLFHVWSPIDPVPLPDACADELMSIHFFEHVYLWEAPALVDEWRRLLKPGGVLVLELPNIVKCCQNIARGIGIEGEGKAQAQGLWGLYGDPRAADPYMHHKWGWSPQTLSKFLAERGFAKIKEEITQWHPGGRKNRDMRIVAIKC